MERRNTTNAISQNDTRLATALIDEVLRELEEEQNR
jgi:hypothetical protein